MKLIKERTINELGTEFSEVYPYLRLDFYKHVKGRLGSQVRQRVLKSASLANAGISREGEIEVEDSMTVGQLEEKFNEFFGLDVQVSRKSGSIWLETTMSDNWTLKQQNDHGRELSDSSRRGSEMEELDN